MLDLKLPYYSQWESPELVNKILNNEFIASDDPNWVKSGAKSKEEYNLWSWNICGMACLKMILKKTLNKDYPSVELALNCARYGGYIVKDNIVEGLYYDPFCKFIQKEFNLKSKVFRRNLNFSKIKEEVLKSNFFIVSVHPAIKDKNKDGPTVKGGHLVLVTGYCNEKNTIFIHNPSGLFGISQINYELTEKEFLKFFAKRGILIYSKENISYKIESNIKSHIFMYLRNVTTLFH